MGVEVETICTTKTETETETVRHTYPPWWVSPLSRIPATSTQTMLPVITNLKNTPQRTISVGCTTKTAQALARGDIRTMMETFPLSSPATSLAPTIETESESETEVMLTTDTPMTADNLLITDTLTTVTLTAADSTLETGTSLQTAAPLTAMALTDTKTATLTPLGLIDMDMAVAALTADTSIPSTLPPPPPLTASRRDEEGVWAGVGHIRTPLIPCPLEEEEGGGTGFPGRSRSIPPPTKAKGR